jgi:hypothetical protein
MKMKGHDFAETAFCREMTEFKQSTRRKYSTRRRSGCGALLVVRSRRSNARRTSHWAWAGFRGSAARSSVSGRGALRAPREFYLFLAAC